MTDENEILTLAEVAAILKCAQSQVYELTRARAKARMSRPLPAFRIHSKMVRIRKSDLMRWLQEMASSQTVYTNQTVGIKWAGKVQTKSRPVSLRSFVIRRSKSKSKSRSRTRSRT